MSELNSFYGVFQVWLGNFVTAEQGVEVMHLQQTPRQHHRFYYPYSSLGQHGLVRLNTLSEQAFCQTLAHMGCIPSALLLGYSLTREYGETRRVICDISAYQYAFLGIEGILQHCIEPGFYGEMQLLFADSLLLDICAYLLKSYQPLGLAHGHHPVIQFCHTVVRDCAGSIRLDS